MRKYRLLSLLILALFAYSCNSWLDVKPEDELDESDMFATGDGYRHALNGIYYGMGGQTLYGEDLTWGLVDVFGRTYTMYSVYGGGNRALTMFYYGVYQNNWDNILLEPEIESIWENAYKMVANCNNLIQNISKEDPDKFAYKVREQKMIWGEALALRAFIQFDMLRLFAASPAMNPGTTRYIPYISEYPSYVSIPLTVDSCLNSAIRDLKEARELLWKADSATTFTAQRRFETTSSSDDFFLEHKRGYRLNYHAATAILARVCLYAQRVDEAYQYAKELIDYNTKTGSFTVKYSSVKDGDIKLYGDVLWGVESLDVIEYINVYNDLTDPSPYKHTYLITTNLDEIFEGEGTKDMRYKKWQNNSSGEYRFSKYEKYDADNAAANVSNYLVPLVRMSEVYYIAAEAIYKKNLNEAKEYLRAVKQSRYASYNSLSLDKVNNATEGNFMDVLINEMRREWIGEGQIFYLYKRLKKDIPFEGNEVVPIEAKYVIWPRPDTESNLK